jgi:hypothetical protein
MSRHAKAMSVVFILLPIASSGVREIVRSRERLSQGQKKFKVKVPTLFSRRARKEGWGTRICLHPEFFLTGIFLTEFFLHERLHFY